MPYFGHTPTNAGSFIEIDDYGSSFNGSTTAFTLQVGGVDVTPNSQNILVMIDGVVQMPTSAYSISGSTITYTEAPPSGADSYVILMGQSASIGQGTIGADELKINGDGTSGQLVKSDGDGTYSYVNQSAITADANVLSGTTLKSTVVNSSLTSVGTLTSLNTTGAVTATGSDYMIKSVSTSTTNGDAIRISAESGVAQGKIEIDWFNASSETGGGYGMIQVGKSANTPELRIGASAVRIGSQQGSQELKVNRSRMRHIDGLADANANFSHGDLYVNHISTGNIHMQRATYFASTVQVDDNDVTLKMNNHGSGIRVNVDRKDTNDFAGYEMRTNGSQRWFIGMRELTDDNLYFFNGNSSGTVQNVLTLNHSNSSATFTGNLTVDTGGSSIITADGNNTSGDDGRILLKGHTAGQSRAYAYFNNGVTSGGLNWYVGNLRGSNAFTITCGNDDYPGYGGGSFNDTVMSIDGNRKIGIGMNPSSAKFSIFLDAGHYAQHIQQNQGDGNCLDLWASSSDEHSNDPIFRCRTDSSNRFQVFNNGGVEVNNSLVHSGSSDERVKKNISTMTNVISDIEKLRGVTFKWRAEVKDLKWSHHNHTKTEYGMIAQEMEAVFPELVTEDGKGIKNIRYEPVISILLQGIKELNERIKVLENA